MSSSSSSSSSSGIGVLGLLGVAFVILKLCEVIDWSWWYVTMPFWGGIALVLGICALCFGGAGILYGIAAFFTVWAKRRNESRMRGYKDRR
jgi:hypothetical protein